MNGQRTPRNPLAVILRPIRQLILALAWLDAACAGPHASLQIGRADWRLESGHGAEALAPSAPGSPPWRLHADGRLSLLLQRPLQAADAKGLALSALIATQDTEACARLEIQFQDETGRDVGRFNSACAQADGRPHPLAVVAQPPPAAVAVRLRLHTLVQGSLDLHQLRGEPVASGTPGLRALVDGQVLDKLDQALEHIRRLAMNRGRVEWDLVAARAAAEALQAHRVRELLPSITLALKALGDGHSWATVLDNDGRMTLGRAATPVPFSVPSHRLQQPADSRPVVLLHMTPLGSTSAADADAYVAAIRQALDEGVRNGACAYVIDLRTHTGGNMWPALAGLGPLLGLGAVGSFKPGPEWLITRSGAVLGGMLAAGASEPGPALDSLASAPVAVLLGPRTASSGEAVAVAFAGRANTRSFGSRTRGLATANQMLDLGDGLRAFVTSGVMLDRHGHSYPAGLSPDQDAGDAEVAEAQAQAWARAGPACRP